LEPDARLDLEAKQLDGGQVKPLAARAFGRLLPVGLLQQVIVADLVELPASADLVAESLARAHGR
jgi:hypothetical protein